MKKVLVTGVLGFIGFSLCRELLNKGYEVIGVDEIVGSSTRIMEEKLNWIGRNSRFQFINSKVEKVQFNQYADSIDVVYHFADMSHSVTKKEKECSIIVSSMELTKRVLSFCNKNIRFIYLSSSSINTEEIETISDCSLHQYRKIKVANETLIRQMSRQNGFPFIIFRLPAIYGPWQRTDMTYHCLMLSKMIKKKVKIIKDFETEDVLYIDDIVNPLIVAGRIPLSNTTIRLSSGKSGEWYKGKKLIIEESSKDEEQFASEQQGIDELQFRATTPLEKGLREQKEHLKRYLYLYNTC